MRLKKNILIIYDEWLLNYKSIIALIIENWVQLNQKMPRKIGFTQLISDSPRPQISLKISFRRRRAHFTT